MNLGPYQHCRSAQAQQGLPLSNLQYGEASSTQAALRHPFSFDGLPRAPQSEQQQQFSASSASNLVPAYNLMNPMSMMPQPQMWDDQLQLNFDEQSGNGNAYYNYSPFAASDNDGTLSRVDLGVPRFIPSDVHQSNRFNSHTNNMLDAYEPTNYLQGPGRSHIIYNGLDSSRDFARLSISRSPLLKLEHELDDNHSLHLSLDRAPTFRLSSNETSDTGSREMTAENELTAEEPYAKLIHRALMSAPNHSMVLQEIYQWFREHTIKGSVKDGNKGWMNSIRHNLSMNAAFKKTERKPQGDETKKSTEWVLEEFAVRDGVQSTTRYRKGTNAKKFTRNDHPAAARQVSGRKGGVATSASKNRFSQLHRRHSRSHHSHTAISHTAERERLREQMVRNEREKDQARHRSPLTPPDTNPYSYSFGSGKMGHEMGVLESPSPYGEAEAGFGLGEASSQGVGVGVYLDGPLFGSNHGGEGHGQYFHAGPM